MKRLVRALAISSLVIPALLSGIAVAQDDPILREPTPAERALVPPLAILENPDSRFPALESPFFDRFSGTQGEFGGVAEAAAAFEAPLGDDVPFVDDVFDGLFTAYRPDSNDYYVNSLYIVVNVVEVTEPVSSCGFAEYREVALFLKRAGLPAIGENPNAPNDPGFGATEAIGLICRNAVTSTFFGLPQDGVPVRYATPYHIFEYEFQGRHFVAFYTLDPFAEYQTVVSFSSDVADQDQYGFTRSGYREYDEPFPDPPYETKDIDYYLYADDVEVPGESSSLEEPQPELTEQELPTQVDVIEEVETDTAPGDETDAGSEPGSDPTPATNSAGAQQDARDTANSTVPFIVGGTAAAVLTGAGIAVARGRRKLVAAKGAKLRMLSDSEELRQAGERAGLPKVDGWQQVPFSSGREVTREPEHSTKREDAAGFERSTDVSLEDPPRAYLDAEPRRIPERFSYWIDDTGTLKIGSHTDPHGYDDAPIEKEGTPMNLDGGPDEKKRIPPA